jgi:hypothetical protein
MDLEVQVNSQEEEVLPVKRKNKLKRLRKGSDSDQEPENDAMPIKEAKHLSNKSDSGEIPPAEPKKSKKGLQRLSKNKNNRVNGSDDEDLVILEDEE